jgi:hypothetical protein
VHILDWQDSSLLLPRLPQSIKSARFLKDGKAAEYTENDYGVLLRIPPSSRDANDTILVLELGEK